MPSAFISVTCVAPPSTVNNFVGFHLAHAGDGNDGHDLASILETAAFEIRDLTMPDILFGVSVGSLRVIMGQLLYAVLGSAAYFFFKYIL